MKSYYPAPQTSGLDLQVVGSCGVLRLHQSALWLIRTETPMKVLKDKSFQAKDFSYSYSWGQNRSETLSPSVSTKLYKRIPHNWSWGKSSNIQPRWSSSLSPESAPQRLKLQTKKKNCITRSVVLQRTTEGISPKKERIEMRLSRLIKFKLTNYSKVLCYAL